MRFPRSIAVLVIALACASPESARAAPANPAAAPPLVDSISADRGSPSMSFNATQKSAGENVLRLLTDDVNRMLRETTIDAERELIRSAGDLVLAAIGDGNTADHYVMYSIAGSVRESGVRSLSVNVDANRVRGAEPKMTAHAVEPWTPRQDSPTRATRAERDRTPASPSGASPSSTIAKASSTSTSHPSGESGSG